MNTSYEYAPYPQSTYESQQIPQPPLRSVRSGSAPHSPHQHSQFPSQNPYPSNYPPPPPYPMAQPPAPPPPQWAPEAWTNYNQPFSSPAPIQDVPFNSGPGRPNDPTVPPTSVEPRPYSSSQSNPTPDPRRTTDRPPTTTSGPAVPATQPKRRRDKETPAPPSGSDTPPRLDFLKLLESYRLIMDSSDAFTNEALSTPGRPPPSETVERMLQSATYGVQMLESAASQLAGPPEARPSSASDTMNGDKEAAEGGASSPSKRQQSQKNEDVPVQEGQTCLGCNATSTPEWRRGPMGPRTLCNACGLVYAKLIKKRVREAGRPFGKMNGQGAALSQAHGDESGLASSGEGGSEDGESYGSPDRRSDGGEGRD